ncbi:MAG: nitrile hydratase subunit alpha [Acidimicrobiia bacterium]|nr:nitrile hydratase subunit alpha [Acidimicrobiia bacterium]
MSHDHEHNHEHGHTHEVEHPVYTYADDSPRDVVETDHYPLMVEALRELLLEREVIQPRDLREALEKFDTVDHTVGPRAVAKAWLDADFKEQLLADGRVAIREAFQIEACEADLVVLENTRDLHNLVVCTLCSCYPRGLMGQPPDWYKSKSYRSRAVHEPRQVMSEYGTEIPDDVTVRVHDSNADMRFMVLPLRPEGTDDWSEEQLSEIVTRDCLVGIALPELASAGE